VAYIKVKITKETTPDTPDVKNYPLTVGKFDKFVCGNSASVTSTVEEFNVQIYNAIGMSRDEFHKKYKFNEEYTNKDNVGKVEELAETVAGVTTYNLKWTLTDQEMWDNAGETVKYVCQYKSTSGDVINITLQSTVDAIKKEYNITHLFSSNWDAAGNALFNVAIDNGSTDASKCVFPGELDAPFTLNEETKLIADVPDFVAYDYTFSDAVKDIKSIGGIATNFTLSEDAKTLKIGDEVIATINDTYEGKVNIIALNKDGANKLALKLLNTKELVLPLQINGEACGEEAKPVAIKVNNSTSFNAKFIRPVNISAKANDSFIDGKNNNEKGSLISLENLIDPTNWLGNKFSTHSNYWSYYGPFSITAATATAQHDANGSKESVASTKIALSTDEDTSKTLADGTTLTSKYGFITYQNNGTAVTKDYNLYIDVTVSYGWGEITETITVPVTATKIQN